jgi:NAD(P)-dependent dehydrogenase (short-subunit alcohol dehydrogenase family)
MNLADKAVVVTGGARGLGLAAAQLSSNAERASSSVARRPEKPQ